MNIYCVDYDKVAIRYKTYVEKAAELDNLKLDHFHEMESYKKEMESIVESSKSGLIVNEQTRRQNADRFKELQNKAVAKENQIRVEYSQKQNDLMESCFQEISAIIDEYSRSKGIDLVINKSQVFYVKNTNDMTDTIIDIIKEKGLYVDLIENEVTNEF